MATLDSFPYNMVTQAHLFPKNPFVPFCKVLFFLENLPQKKYTAQIELSAKNQVESKLENKV
jgi:hypothetical protein